MLIKAFSLVILSLTRHISEFVFGQANFLKKLRIVPVYRRRILTVTKNLKP